MSLKAKLEAVIYAAEEPVTLAQLAALFAADALEWKATQEAAIAAPAAEQAVTGGEPLSQINAEFDYQELQQRPEVSPDIAQESGSEPAAETAGAEGDVAAGSEAVGETSAEREAVAQADSEAEAKRLAPQQIG